MAIAVDLTMELLNLQDEPRTIEFHSQETLNNHRRLKRDHMVGTALERANQLLKEIDKEIKTP